MIIITLVYEDASIGWAGSGVTILDDATHNHPIDMAEIKAHKISSRLKTKAQETAQPLPTQYSQEVSQTVTDVKPRRCLV